MKMSNVLTLFPLIYAFLRYLRHFSPIFHDFRPISRILNEPLP